MRVIERFVTIDTHPDPGDHPPSCSHLLHLDHLPPPPGMCKNASQADSLLQNFTGFLLERNSTQPRKLQLAVDLTESGCAVAATCRLEPLLLPGRKSHTHSRAPPAPKLPDLASRSTTISLLPSFYTCRFFHIAIFPSPYVGFWFQTLSKFGPLLVLSTTDFSSARVFTRRPFQHLRCPSHACHVHNHKGSSINYVIADRGVSPKDYSIT